MAHLQLPTSGNSEGEGVIPIIATNLENTGKSKKGNNMNPHHPQEDSNGGSKVLKELDGVKTTDSGRKSPYESPLHRNAGDTPKRTSRHSDRSFEVSPLHPHSHSRLGGNKGSGVSSPSWERKGSSEGGRGIAPSTPVRSRLRPVMKGDDTPDDSPVVPKFGDWDDTDPASAEQFTQVFDRVRDEKQSGAEKVPVMPHETSYPNSEKHYRSDISKGCSCFPWLRK